MYDGDGSSGVDNVLLEFQDTNGSSPPPVALKTRYLLGGAVDQVFAQEDVPTSTTNWLIQDRQGTVRDVLNNSGQVVNHIIYDSFGKITDVQGTTTTLATNRLYTGQTWDADVQMFYYKARWYDPRTQTFISRDPIGFAAGDANLYRPFGNSPTHFIDPSGQSPVPLPFPEAPNPPPGPNGPTMAPATTTEEDLVAQLRATAEYWASDNKPFAAAQLLTFLSRKNGVPGELIDRSRFSGEVQDSAVFKYKANTYFDSIALRYVQPCKTVVLHLNDRNVLHIIGSNVSPSNSAFDVQFPPPSDLFYAVGGAVIGYTNAKLIISPLQPDGSFHWRFQGQMQLLDDYTFPDVSIPYLPFTASRRVFADYNAAHILEEGYNYASFLTYMKWNETITGVHPTISRNRYDAQ